MDIDISKVQPTAISAWQKRAELEALNLGQSAECGRVCFWGMMNDFLQDWPQDRFIQWTYQVRRVYGEESLQVYDSLMKIAAAQEQVFEELMIRLLISTPGEVISKYRSDL